MYTHVYLFLTCVTITKKRRKVRGNEDIGRFAGGGRSGNYVNTVLIVEIRQKLIK